MPNTLQDKIDKRANIWSQMTEIMTRSADSMTAEDQAAYDKAERDLDGLTGEIERDERHIKKAAEFAKVDRSAQIDPAVGAGDEKRDKAVGAEAYESAWRSWMRYGREGLNADERRTLQGGFVSSTELRAEGVSPTSAGGFLIPQGFRQVIIETLKYFSSVRRVAEVITTSTGNTLPWPTNDDTANVGVLLAENTQMSEQDVVFGQTQLGAYMYTSKMTRVSLQLLQDSAFDLEPWLARKLGQRIGRIQNQHFTTGTGTSQPEGIQTNAVIGKTGLVGQTTSVIYDDLIDLIHAVDPAYRDYVGNDDNSPRNSPGTPMFMLHDKTLAAVRKLKDTQGHPLWQPSLTAGVPNALVGYGYAINNDMPQMAANVKSVLFGDLHAAFVIRDVSDIQVLRLDERFADFLQVAFLAFARADSKQQDAGAYRAYANSAT